MLILENIHDLATRKIRFLFIYVSTLLHFITVRELNFVSKSTMSVKAISVLGEK